MQSKQKDQRHKQRNPESRNLHTSPGRATLSPMPPSREYRVEADKASARACRQTLPATLAHSAAVLRKGESLYGGV